MSDSIFKDIATARLPACLATILHQDGSTPRTAGARMLVFADGAIHGNIGGGLVEANAMKKAAQVLHTGETSIALFDLAGQQHMDMDMICGGSLEVLLEPVDKPLQKAFADLAAHLEAGRVAAMVTLMTGRPGAIQRTVLHQEAGRWHGMADATLTPVDPPNWLLETVEAGRRLWETHHPAPTLYLFGAGHVAQATAVVAHTAGFRVVVLDDRPEFANAHRYPIAARILTPPSFDAIFQWPPMAEECLGPESHMAILTRGHRDDATVLAQALRTPAGWIGMIGSRTKRDATYEKLRQEGLTDDDFDRVHCPIGLPIGAQTPGEIAVSIMAQCIQHRTGRHA